MAQVRARPLLDNWPFLQLFGQHARRALVRIPDMSTSQTPGGSRGSQQDSTKDGSVFKKKTRSGSCGCSAEPIDETVSILNHDSSIAGMAAFLWIPVPWPTSLP